jgi:uncharacterized FlgJ-related protein
MNNKIIAVIWTILAIMLTGVIIFTLILFVKGRETSDKNKKSVQIYKTTLPVDIEKDTTFSKEKFIKYVHSLNPKYPDIIIAQAILETGHFKSFIFHNNNNLFGMTIIGDRANMANGHQYGYAYFDTWKKSVIDYVIYQSLYLNNKSREEYLEYLDSVYAEDPCYIDKIQTISKNYKTND